MNSSKLDDELERNRKDQFIGILLYLALSVRDIKFIYCESFE